MRCVRIIYWQEILHAVLGSGINTVSSGGDFGDWEKREVYEREAHDCFGSHQSGPPEEDMCGEFACAAYLHTYQPADKALLEKCVEFALHLRKICVVSLPVQHISIPTNLQTKLCLKNVSNLPDLEYYCLKMLRVHSECMGMVHHRLARKIGIWRFLVG